MIPYLLFVVRGQSVKFGQRFLEGGVDGVFVVAGPTPVKYATKVGIDLARLKADAVDRHATLNSNFTSVHGVRYDAIVFESFVI